MILLPLPYLRFVSDCIPSFPTVHCAEYCRYNCGAMTSCSMLGRKLEPFSPNLYEVNDQIPEAPQV